VNSLILTVLFYLVATVAVPAHAVAEVQDAQTTDASAEASDDDAEVVGWVKQLDDAQLRLELAQKELDTLANAKGRGAARRYPRGDAKAKYLDDLANTRTEYEAARRALPDLVEEARRAGVPVGLLEKYESAAEAAAPMANADDVPSDADEVEEQEDDESDVSNASD
jgi:hypothetical protein